MAVVEEILKHDAPSLNATNAIGQTPLIQLGKTVNKHKIKNYPSPNPLIIFS